MVQIQVLKPQKVDKLKLRDKVIVTKAAPGSRMLYAQDHPLPILQLISNPRSHHPWSSSGGVVTPPTWDLQLWDNGAGSIEHSAVTKASHWQAFSSRWEVGPLELDMAGLSVPDNKLCLVRSAFMGSVMLLSRDVLSFHRPASAFCGWATVLGNPSKQKGTPWLVISHI